MDLDFQNGGVSILKEAIDGTNEGFVTIDENHKIVFFNKGAEKIFGYTRNDVIGRDLDVIMTPSCSQDHRFAIESYVKTRLPRRIGHESELVGTRKNGDTFPASISFSVTEIEKRLFFTGIVKDLTETVKLQEKIKRSERLADLGQFIAEITHEIKNPLMMIGGFAGQLKRETKDQKSLRKLKIIGDEVRRLEELIKDLGELYRSGQIAYEQMDVTEFLKNIYAFVKNDCESKNIKIELKCEDGPLLIKGNKDRLRQVFLNLIKNSMDATKNGGTLSLNCQREGDLVEIIVKDDGCGLSKEDLKEAFSPFFTKKEHGTGLGLSVSKRIIEDHNGSVVFLDSEEGKGTEIQVSIPALNK
ncbi:MAG: ATP-binding protein [Thermodesulfobacteriota bacterium]|nr:ATP-binding protein [Thermodesulfobacteriota bacterium]